MYDILKLSQKNYIFKILRLIYGCTYMISLISNHIEYLIFINYNTSFYLYEYNCVYYNNIVPINRMSH